VISLKRKNSRGLEGKKTFSTGIILTVRSQNPHAVINHENIKLKQRQQPFT
jgi:hypothetical protein